MKAQRTSANHDRMVFQAARQLHQRHYRGIRSRVGDFERPDAIRIDGADYTPDITMVNRNDTVHLLEVETPDVLQNGNGAAKWRAISECAAKRGAIFYLVVPDESKAKAVARLQELNLQANVWGLKKIKMTDEED